MGHDFVGVAEVFEGFEGGGAEEVFEGLAGGGGGEDEGELFPEGAEGFAVGDEGGGGDAGGLEGFVVEPFLATDGADMAVTEEGFEAVLFGGFPDALEVEGERLVVGGGGLETVDVAVAAVVLDAVGGGVGAHRVEGGEVEAN